MLPRPVPISQRVEVHEEERGEHRHVAEAVNHLSCVSWAGSIAVPRDARSSPLRRSARVVRTAHDAALHREGDRFRPATGAESGEGLRDVPVHRAFNDAESGRDLFRGLPSGDVLEDLDFSPRQRHTDS